MLDGDDWCTVAPSEGHAT